MEHNNDEDIQPRKSGKLHNVLPLWGNEASMNLNPLILTNIQSSSYFKVSLFKLKTYHEVVDEIYYQVKHLEPWEKGSRKTAGQTGMCGGVRGVGAGGIVSTAYCLLYKLYTLRLTRKQVNGLLTHTDSPYIRALGFMYIRYTQPPSDLYDWYEEYLQDDEEMDVKAGGGQIMTIGQMCRQWLVKLDWFSTLFPRIPVPIQKSIEKRLEEYSRKHNLDNRVTYAEKEMNRRRGEEQRDYSERSGGARSSGGNGSRSRDYWPSESKEYHDEHDRRKSRSKSRERYSSRDTYRDRSERDGHRRERDSNRERDTYKDRDSHKSREAHRERDSFRDRDNYRERDSYKERERTDYYRSEPSSYDTGASSSHKYRDREHDRNYR